METILESLPILFYHNFIKQVSFYFANSDNITLIETPSQADCLTGDASSVSHIMQEGMVEPNILLSILSFEAPKRFMRALFLLQLALQTYLMALPQTCEFTCYILTTFSC